MSRFTIGRVFGIGALLLLLTTSPAKADWTWKDRLGNVKTAADLDGILNLHDVWIGSHGGAGRKADLYGANLTGANLFRRDLTDADLTDVNLTSADLRRTSLIRVDLTRADLTDAWMEDAWLGEAIFEPKATPRARDIAQAVGLADMTYSEHPDALTELRKKFQDGGFREQEREITYALKRKEAEVFWNVCRSSPTTALDDCISFVFNWFFFDLTCQYGMSPGRPLRLGVSLWFLCSILYFASIRTRGEAGLYRVYAQSIKDDPPGQRRVERITPPALTQTRGVRRLLQFLWRALKVLRASMFFSLMSAFNIGFRDINFGRWLRLLTRQEFDMKAVGWARVVAGWQSLISVYFIALWVLTYFGRPFG